MAIVNGAIYALLKSNKDSSKSLEKQFKTCTRYAGAHEINIVGVYFDNLADADIGRPDMERMLADVEEKGINCIVVVDLSCIDLDIHKAGKYLEEMKAKGLNVISIEGVGGNLFESGNHFLPESIFKYLHESDGRNQKPAKRRMRGKPVNANS